jgi:lipopolysaccharide export LptBFGC system permease protein LptF
MGRTLFWYIFRDLMKIFFMANGALAGIMSFGGLLRPLTHQGLDVGQIGKLLGYFNLAMLTYSMPIAALFATTVVYGRLSADNEVTACRAGGLSHLTVAFPAFVMGVFVALLSLVFLCFVVPVYTMKAEQTLYSNIAKLIAGRIQREHKIDLGPGLTIFAQEAYIPEGKGKDGEQMVVLKGPTIETIERPYNHMAPPKRADSPTGDASETIYDPTYHVPKDFYTASEAVIYIEQLGKGQQRGTGKVHMMIHLVDGLKFPREFQGAVQFGVETAEYGPIEFDSPTKEDPKFMDVWKLKRLYHNPVEGEKVKQKVDELVRRDQQALFAQHLADDLNDKGEATFRFGNNEIYSIHRDPDAPPAVASRQGELVIPVAIPADTLCAFAGGQVGADAAMAAAGLLPLPALPAQIPPERRPITFRRQIEGQAPADVHGREAHLVVRNGADPGMIRVNLELFDAVNQSGDETVDRKIYRQQFTVPMPPDVAAIGTQGLGYYERMANGTNERQVVGRALLVLSNQILSESHSRVSFAISCLVLVMVGCALGLMFRSGNFLSAFAVSFIPALFTITLIVAGQRVSGSVPEPLTTEIAKYANSPLSMGMGLIWTGNCVNFVLAVVLLGRLQRK